MSDYFKNVEMTGLDCEDEYDDLSNYDPEPEEGAEGSAAPAEVRPVPQQVAVKEEARLDTQTVEGGFGAGVGTAWDVAEFLAILDEYYDRRTPRTTGPPVAPECSAEVRLEDAEDD